MEISKGVTHDVRHGMKNKTIKAILTKKIDQWAETIEDEHVRKLVKKGTIVTGGCIASMLLGEDVNDFDVYLRDHHTASAVANYYVKQFKLKKDIDLEITDIAGRIKIVVPSIGVAEALVDDSLEDTAIELPAPTADVPYAPVFLSSNAITLSDKIQIVLRFYGEPEVIHENYDFTHCTSYWKSWDHELVLRPEALESLLSKELRYVGSKYPVCSVVRLRKFIARGWRINAGHILKMAMQISELDLTNIEVLEDQLTGVDTSYFLQLIAALRERDPERVNTAYLIEIIDRLF